METHDLWTHLLNSDWPGYVYNITEGLNSHAVAHLADGRLITFVTLIFHQLWANKILTLCLVTAGFVYYHFSRPIHIFYDHTGIKCDSFYNVDSAGTSGVSATHRIMNRLHKDENIINTPFYPNGWFRLCDSDMVGKNDVRYIVALGENFAVFRTSTGKVHVVDAYCPHLGANMAVGGKVKDDCLECPFHAWQFDGESGKCKSIPYSEKVPDFAKVRTWISREVNNIIFVWYHAEGDEPSWEIPPIDDIESGHYWLSGKVEHIFNDPIQDTIENFADYRHLGPVHEPLTVFGDERYSKILRSFLKIHFSAGDSRSVWEVDSNDSHISWTKYFGQVRLLDKYVIYSAHGLAKLIGPSYVELSMTSLCGNSKTLVCFTPIGPFTTRQISLTYSRPRDVFFGRLIMVKSFKMDTNRDLHVYSYRKIVAHANTIAEDGPITRFRRWYGQFFSENSPRLKYQTNTFSW